MKAYRALISVPIRATGDTDAFNQAVDCAHSLELGGGIVGHLELVGEVADSELLRVARVSYEDPRLREQLGPKED